MTYLHTPEWDKARAHPDYVMLRACYEHYESRRRDLAARIKAGEITDTEAIEGEAGTMADPTALMLAAMEVVDDALLRYLPAVAEANGKHETVVSMATIVFEGMMIGYSYAIAKIEATRRAADRRETEE